MPDIHFSCSSCGARLAIDVAAAGRALDCPHCRAAIRVPDVFTLPSEADVAPFRGRIAELEAALRESQAQAAGLEKAAEALRSAAAARDRAVEELSSARREADESRAAEAALKAELDSVRAKMAAVGADLEAKTAALAEAATKMAEAQARVSALDARIRSVEEKARSAEREESADRKVREELRQQLDDVRDLRRKVAEKEAESLVFAQQRSDWAEERARQARFLDELKQASAAVMKENQDLKDRLALQPSETQAGVIRRAEEDAARIEALAKENAELKARLRVMSAGLRHRV